MEFGLNILRLFTQSCQEDKQQSIVACYLVYNGMDWPGDDSLFSNGTMII